MAPNVPAHSFVEDPTVFRRAEIEESRVYKTRKSPDREPLYIIIDDKVYDVREFVSDHPGGAVIMTHVGMDATDPFNNFHQASTHEILSNYYVGDLAPEDVLSASKASDFTNELRQVKEHFRQLGYFASSKRYYVFKMLSNISILLTSVTVLVRYGDSVAGVLVAAFFMGLFWQQCGWLSHDFLHHQVFENRYWNNVMGAYHGGVCQGFALNWWKDKHNTHHATPNVHGQDPDIATHPLLTWSDHALMDIFTPEFYETSPFPPFVAQFLVRHQTFFYVPILCVARISWCIQSAMFVLPGGQERLTLNPSLARMPISTLERVSLLVHYAWYFTIVYAFIPTISLRATFFLASQAICGMLLALVFGLNHNGMKVLTEHEAEQTDFFVQQVVTGRDVMTADPRLQWTVDWFCGGLNYQIEHHIFPTLPRHVFHKVQPLIEALCKKYGVPYHRTTFLQGTREVFAALNNVSVIGCKLE